MILLAYSRIQAYSRGWLLPLLHISYSCQEEQAHVFQRPLSLPYLQEWNK